MAQTEPGAVLLVWNMTGAVAVTYTYDSFGFLHSSSGSATNWFRYTARQFDSDTALENERKFVEKLKKRTDIRLFVKLPSWFKVVTPLGQYNPDWGLVMEEVDAFGEHGPLLYLVRETKTSTAPAELRGTENQKTHCGERHFVGALGVDYRVITSADELP